jgi:5-methylcytosine-specific restriction endonuclease McrA
MSRADEVAALELIRDRRFTLNLRRQGPCLICGSAIRYGTPDKAQRTRGDEWLDKLFKKWHKPPYVHAEFRSVTFNGYRLDRIKPYLCQECHTTMSQQVVDLLARAEAEFTERVAQRCQAEKEEDWQMIDGTVKVSAKKRFHALCRHMTPDESEELRKMPYEEFLETIYWDVIRSYVLQLNHYRCGLCSQRAELDVHHRTYEHRGYEYLHLEDLVALCETCHAKFHDRLA